MADFDEAKRQLTFKLVYYGPGLSGKTTNLIRLHELLAPERRGEVMTLETRNDRTLFFDLMPTAFTTASGLKVRFKVFTVPGQVTLDSTRKAILSRADGVVFVVDSQRSQAINNSQSFESLEQNARKVGLELESLPMVVQFNKRDLPDAMTEQELRARWQAAPWPLTFASAASGEGVLQTFRTLVEQVYRKAGSQFSMSSEHGLSEQSFVAAALGD